MKPPRRDVLTMHACIHGMDLIILQLLGALVHCDDDFSAERLIHVGCCRVLNVAATSYRSQRLLFEHTCMDSCCDVGRNRHCISALEY